MMRLTDRGKAVAFMLLVFLLTWLASALSYWLTGVLG